MSELTPFGKALRKLRIEKSLRLLDLATKLDVSTSFLSAVETGKKPIPNGFVRKLSHTLTISQAELEELHRAEDRTRTEVPVDDKKEEDRELIAALARRLDDPGLRERLRKLLKSLVGEVPFERKRRGFLVPPLSTSKIRQFAESVRSHFVPDERIAFPIIEVLEWLMPTVDPNFVLVIRPVEEMGDDEGLVPINRNELILREDVYEGACTDSPRDRFTCCHEFSHYLMHRRIGNPRTRDDNEKIFQDSEWQADTFAGTLLMSNRHLRYFHDADDMAAKCKVSGQAASVMWAKYLDEGAISRSPELPGLLQA
jgi:transcriptional regulator with XRE-family HTH domain